MSTRWSTLCAGLAEPRWVRLLDAFSGATEAEYPDEDALLGELPALAVEVGTRIRVELTELDAPQRAMFARRFLDVCNLLAETRGAEARVLGAGLVHRTREILDAPGTRGIRVRAAVDFYYSQLAVLRHRREGAPEVESLVRGGVGREVLPGLVHTRVEGLSADGPVHINVLAMRRGRFEAHDCRERGFDTLVAESGAAAAVSGGFFLYSEPDIEAPSRRTDPVGLLVTGGEVRVPPLLRRAALIQAEGFAIRRVGPVGLQMSGLPIEAVNDAEFPGVTAFNRAFGSYAPDREGVAVVGSSVVAVGRSLAIPLNGAVVTLPPGVALPREIVWSLPSPVQSAMAGGPLLLEAGGIDLAVEDFAGTAPPLTFSQDETFDQNLLPRMAAGLRADGTLVFVAADGRNLDRAPGVTLGTLARVCRALGCVQAMNLDGGSSKRMIVAGEVVDLPSTEVVANGSGSERVRPVHSGILLFPG